jgi:hypothetical protein
MANSRKSVQSCQMKISEDVRKTGRNPAVLDWRGQLVPESVLVPLQQ